MTARSDDPDVSPGTAAAGGEIWDTWEELLLASAVKRHGTARWDLVAMEMQSRCASASDARFTPSACRLRFRLLHRRLAPANAENAGGGDDDDEDPDAAAVDECVEKLRKLRVAELRREVERHDLSIGSLKSKVKRLEEERERSISGEDEEAPTVKDEAEDEEAVLAKGSLEDDDLAGEDRVSGGESGRSCKESNSADLKLPGHDAGTSSARGDDDAAVREKEEAAGAGESASVKREEASGESVAGSKETDAEKESSDVQSAASPSRRREREGGGREEAEVEEASPSTSAPAALPAAEAEALSAFLESVRTSKAGSVFERRLESQDDANYRSTIRRHVDLETIRAKLEGGSTRYSSASEFYRDLLLLCANALVFFPRGSPEHAAAVQTRAFVTKHMSASLRKDQPGSSGKPAAGPSAASKKPKADADVGSLLEKTAPIMVCRKRSSIAKAAAAAAKAEKAENEETEDEEDEVKKKVATKDKTRGLRTNKTRGGLARKAGPNQRAAKDSESEAAAAEGTKKSDKKGGGGAAAGGVAKKRNAVDFLNRMKQNSGPSTERVSLLETLKLSAAAEQKKSGKGEARKESGSGSKRGKDTPPGRRIGRPPKRAAAPPSPPPSKRARGSGRRGGKK
ncbi:hypothetical protein PR202_ga21446 [Eleusine coracana subsp. coracana]|uniref:DNA-binding bromodomain-containing protein n=1 Tax=Eleusine coracana subsp. coracana TaxID=191504 RepID=A0AAV5D122_ELECO|nr:hypothetical protein QOZ80_8AG0636730 [Eleusine coracana subsp. coracana]GJN03945.1 hypothetical protein PR202_ga21446 [Eleusine coracana subsp. coracana]